MLGARRGGFGGNTKMACRCILVCTLFGYFGDVPKGNTNNGDSHNDDDEPGENGAMDIHIYLLVMAYL